MMNYYYKEKDVLAHNANGDLFLCIIISVCKVELSFFIRCQSTLASLFITVSMIVLVCVIDTKCTLTTSHCVILSVCSLCDRYEAYTYNFHLCNSGVFCVCVTGMRHTLTTSLCVQWPLVQ